MNLQKKILACASIGAGLCAAGAIAAAAQNIPTSYYANVGPGAILDFSWSAPANGWSKTVFADCHSSGSSTSPGYVTWNVRHPGAFGQTAYVGEKSLICRSTANGLNWYIGPYQPGNQLTLAKSPTRIDFAVTVEDSKP